MAKKTVLILSHTMVAGKVKDIGAKVTLSDEDANLLIGAGQACAADDKDAAARVKGAKARYAAQTGSGEN